LKPACMPSTRLRDKVMKTKETNDFHKQGAWQP
jgi:hypothetical protein